MPKPKGEKRIEKAFNNFKHNGVHLNFPNGNHISTIWGACSYSDNHSASLGRAGLNPMVAFESFLQSDTCEAMVDCGEKLLKRLQRKFYVGDSNVFGYLSISEWLYILNAVAKEKR